ncbi:pentapeptide repeat-containing protein [Maridesulfovibrio sp. FT414]|uniref:pentapeptide repeat-containing protein n=1 Tax=Maridesulfovibrio sp. FT414 TaxID=2979469 RepID=UPI003D8005E0
MEITDWILLSLAFTPLILVYLYSYNYDVFYFLYNYSGIRAIVEKIHPPTEEQQQDCYFRKPSTFMLWAVSIYVALFSIASARYDRAVNSYEQQISTFQTQMATEFRAQACGNFNNLQSIKVPVKPDLFFFWKTLSSFVDYEEYEVGQSMLTKTIEAYSRELDNAHLKNATLTNCYFESSNFKKAYLIGNNLTNTVFSNSILHNTYFWFSNCTKTNFSNANMTKAEFLNAKLHNATFCNADLTGANFLNAEFDNAFIVDSDLTNAQNLTAEQLSTVRILHKTKLPVQTEKELINKYPHILEKPDWYKEDEQTN